MVDKREILLNSSSLVSKSSVDVFIDIELSKSSSELKQYKRENNFDILLEYTKERNNCRNFLLYGLIESTGVDCENIFMQVFDNSDKVPSGSSYQQIYSKPISYFSGSTNPELFLGNRNIFNKQKGKYYFDLQNFSAQTAYLFIAGNGVNFGDLMFPITLNYLDSSGLSVPFGTETVDISLDGIVTTISNDFPFFYNSHWVKTNLDVDKHTNISFDFASYNGIEGSTTIVNVSLNYPSRNGLENA